MTIDELIEKLEEAREDMSGETEIRIAYQSSYPLRATIQQVRVPEEDEDPCGGEEEHEDGKCPNDPPFTKHPTDNEVLWLAVDQDYDQPYAPSWPWQ